LDVRSSFRLDVRLDTFDCQSAVSREAGSEL